MEMKDVVPPNCSYHCLCSDTLDQPIEDFIQNHAKNHGE